MQKKTKTTLSLTDTARADLDLCARVMTEGNWSRMVTDWAKRGAARVAKLTGTTNKRES